MGFGRFRCREFKEATITRSANSHWIAGNLALVLSIALGGCDRFKSNDPQQAAKVRAQVKRQQTACASPAANDRLKNSIFDAAIARRAGRGTNLDLLADYSVARMQDPVVERWDPSLDITHCKGRFILEVPPGAEPGLGGTRELQADIEYTAQASADGTGYVYQQKGAEPIIARLAAFNLASVAYRPPPAIDEAQAPAEPSEQAPVAEAPAPARPPTAPPRQSAPPIPQRRIPSAPLKTTPRGHIAERTLRPSESAPPTPIRSRSGNGEATVRAFYGALGAGNGTAAASQVIPEKRSSGPFSPGAISSFYGRLPEPIRLTSVVPVAGGAYHVTYRYSAGRSRCDGSAVVTVTQRGGRTLIRSIRSQSGC